MSLLTRSAAAKGAVRMLPSNRNPFAFPYPRRRRKLHMSAVRASDLDEIQSYSGGVGAERTKRGTFMDRVRIQVNGGNGGKGVVAFEQL